MQSIRITSRSPLTITKWNQLSKVQMNIYLSNICRKDLSWLHFDDEPRVQERQQVKDQQSYIFVFVLFLTVLSTARSTIPDMTTVFHACLYERFIEMQSNLRRKKLHTTNQGSNFPGESFRDRGKVRTSI